MGLSKSSSQSKAEKAQASGAQSQANMLNTQDALLGEQFKNFQVLNPLMLQQEVANLSSPVWGAKRDYAGQLVGMMPKYQEMGLNNPNVQQIYGLLKSQGEGWAKDLLNQQQNELGKHGEFGSSYHASQNARLGELFGRLDSENMLNALNVGTQLYQTNLGNFTNYMDWLMGQGNKNQVAMPTATSAGGVNGISGSSSGMSDFSNLMSGIKSGADIASGLGTSLRSYFSKVKTPPVPTATKN